MPIDKNGFALLIFAAVFGLAMCTSQAIAGELRVKYPAKYCDTIMSQEYSTGGGDSAFQFIEILCKDAEGNYKGFMLRMGSVSGWLGMGRLTTPDVIVYTPYSGDTLVEE